MKILYAAGNRPGSYYQLKRFLTSVDSKYEVRVSAYFKHAHQLNIDYNLDSLLNFINPNGNISFNGNYNYYYNEIKRFAPDIIISDMEIFSSIVANELGIKLWQWSPLTLYYGLNEKDTRNLGIYKHYSYLISGNHNIFEYTRFILKNSDRKFVLSHLCDSEKRPELISGFEWSRPDFIIGNNKNKFKNIIITDKLNTSIIDKYNNKNNILFTHNLYETYNIASAKIDNDIEYQNSIENCQSFISDGLASFLSDAFYNQKYSIIYPQYNDFESLLGAYSSEYFGLGSFTSKNDLKEITIKIDDSVSFIHNELVNEASMH